MVEKALVAVCDILGFRDLVKRSTFEELVDHHIPSIINVQKGIPKQETLSAVGVGRKFRLSQSTFPGHLDLLILGHEERKAMKKIQCNVCGSDRYEERRIEYLYSHKGKYLLVPNTPVEVCLRCGMVYYDAGVLKEIERRFFAIQKKEEKPDAYIELPRLAFG